MIGGGGSAVVDARLEVKEETMVVADGYDVVAAGGGAGEATGAEELGYASALAAALIGDQIVPQLTPEQLMAASSVSAPARGPFRGPAG